MTERLKTILLTIPVTLALIALSFGSWWLWAVRPGLTADSDVTAATRYYAYVYGTARDASGAPVANVKVTINGKSSTTNASGEWGVTPAVTVGETYNFEITTPDGWQLTQWPQSFTATEPPDPIGPFAIVLAPIPAPQPTATSTPSPTPKPSATPSRTATLTPEPTFPCPPTEEGQPTVPCCTPTATPKCVAGYQQFSWAERQTIISTGYRYLHGGLEDDVDMMTDSTLAIGNAQRFLAPLTRAYVVTGDNGARITCRGFAYAIVCQRADDPCGEFGVVDWGGPMMMLQGGEWGIAP